MVISSGIGAWVGAGLVSRMPRRGIQVFMGVALVIAAGFMVLLGLLGMHPIAAYPIMIGSDGVLIPVATLGFRRSGRFSHSCAVGLTLGGLLGTLCAFPLVNLIGAHLTLMRRTSTLCPKAASRLNLEEKRSRGEIAWRNLVPIYEYRCAANGAVIEVQHKMAEELHTWGELCDRAGIARGRTNPKAAVEKLMSAGYVSTGANESPCDAPVCGSGGCGGGMCGMN